MENKEFFDEKTYRDILYRIGIIFLVLFLL